jgi:hypothetical protein
MTGIKDAQGIQPLLCHIAEAVALMTWISHASCVLLLTSTTRKTLQLPLSHICFTHCLHYQTPVWVFWREFCYCWPYHYECVTNGHGICPIAIPRFNVPWGIYLIQWLIICVAKHIRSLASQLSVMHCGPQWTIKMTAYSFMSYRCSSYCNSRIWHFVLILNITVNMQLILISLKCRCLWKYLSSLTKFTAFHWNVILLQQT